MHNDLDYSTTPEETMLETKVRRWYLSLEDRMQFAYNLNLKKDTMSDVSKNNESIWKIYNW